MKLAEMTAHAGSQEHFLKQYVEHALSQLDKFEYVGDIEGNCQVLRLQMQYLLVNKEEFIGYFYVDDSGQRAALKMAYVNPKFRRQSFFSKFIWFIVRHEGVKHLEISNVHSKDTFETLKKLSNRMDLFWEKDGKREKYDPNNLEKYYGSKPTGWVVVVENEDDFSGWPRFFDINKPDMKQHYDWLLEKVAK